MKVLITISLLALVFTTQAQTIAVSEDLTLRNEASYELLGEISGQILLFRNRITEFEVQGFDPSMKLVWSKLLDLDKRNPQIIHIIPGKIDFTILYMYRNKGNTIIKAQSYDAGANLIDSATVKNLGYLFYTPGFEVARSEDKTKLLLYHVERQNIIKAMAIDIRTMKMLWEKNFLPEDYYYGQDLTHFVIDNEGNMHMMIERDNYRSRKRQHFYEVWEYYGEDDQLRKFNIAMEGRLTYDVQFAFDNLNQHLVAAGLYGEKDADRAMGYFYLNVDPENNKTPVLSFEAFDDELMANLLGKSNYNSNRGIDEIKMSELVLRKDGGLLLIAERTKELTRRASSINNRAYYDSGSRAIIDYYYDELMVISIHPTGATHWKNVLHKKQYSQDDDAAYSSYFLFKTPSNLRFLFNDEIRYENTVSEYVINGLGESDRNSILSTQNLELRLRFRDAVQVSANELVVPSERRNRLKLVKMVY